LGGQPAGGRGLFSDISDDDESSFCGPVAPLKLK